MKLLKKVIAVMCCLIIGVGGTITVYSESLDYITGWLEKLNVIYRDSFYSKDSVCRIEALPVIMRAFGLDDESIGKCSPTFISPPFGDITIGTNGKRDIMNKKISCVDRAYVFAAVGHGWIYNGAFFHSFDNITADEALAMIVRFKEHKTAIGYGAWFTIGIWGDLKYTHQYAQENGLLQENDRFYENGDIEITADELKLLLYRLMNQPAFWYFNDGQYYDLERSKTYADILNGNYPESGRKWGWQEQEGIFPGDEQYKEIESEKLYET